MDIIQISNQIPDEETAIQYFERVRWGKKPKCSYCGSTNLTGLQKDYRRKCRDCDKTSSITAGTQLQGTRVPLKTWLYAFAIITDAKKGLSALQLQRNIGVSYVTAFNMYHKAREFMVSENKEMPELENIVEMDETYIGGKPRKMADFENFSPKKRADLDKRIKELKDKGVTFAKGKTPPKAVKLNPKRGRGTDNIPVVGMVERNGNVVAEVMKNLTYENLKKMVKKNVDEKNAVLVTDEYSGYNKMKQIIEHIKIDHKKFYSYKNVNTNSIESFWAIIERGIMGQYHHVSTRKLPNYVAEFVYKYNNRNDNDIMFKDMVRNSMLPTSI